MTAPQYPNGLRQALPSGAFLTTVEIVTPDAAGEFEQALRPALALARAVADDRRIHGIAITDRVRSDSCHDPVAVGHRVAEIPPVPDAVWGSCSWVTHFRGEGRRILRLPASPGRRDRRGGG